MKTFEYKPMGEEGEPSSFEGHVKIEIPTYKERLSIVRTFNIDDAKSGDIDKALQIISLVEKYTLEVKLSHKELKESINNLDELSYYKEGTAIINDIGKTILNGISLNNPL